MSEIQPLANLFLKESFDNDLDSIFKKSTAFSAPFTLNKVLPSNNNSNKNLNKSKIPQVISSKSIASKAKSIEKTQPEGPEKDEKTIFVGNLSIEAVEKKGKKVLMDKFSEFGKIQTIRFRSLAFEAPHNRKESFIKKKFHAKRSIANAYIVFETAEAAKSSLSANGTLLFGRHLRVDSIHNENKAYSKKHSIFVGNLSFEIEEEPLWNFFSSCGKVAGVRIVRDKKTNLGKGFAYVLFEDPSSVQLALGLNEATLEERKLRITRCQDKTKPAAGEKRKVDKILVIEGERSSQNPTKIKKKKASPSCKKRSKAWKAQTLPKK